MSLAPAILQTQQIIIQNNHRLIEDLEHGPNALDATTNSGTMAPFTSLRSRYSQRALCTRSSLERFGIYRRKTIHYCYLEPYEISSSPERHRIENIHEADEISVMWNIIGFGATWIRQRSHGKMFPSLTTYPGGILSDAAHHVIWRGSVRDLQDMFSSGTLHPFLRSPDGSSLLHVSRVCKYTGDHS
jgi:hypothetical protein